MKHVIACAFIAICAAPLVARAAEPQAAPDKRPNILFAIADDWGWPHASAYGDPVVKTPAFDRIAREGVLFERCFVSSPSCTPSRNAILTGQYHWRLETGANLHSSLDTRFPVYPLLLQKAGYHVGHWRKSFGPGKLEPGGYTDSHPAGKSYPQGLRQFLADRPADAPFCFWLGATDPHRPYAPGSGKASGMDLSRVRVPGFFPDTEAVRSDIADYYYEVQRFDSDVADAIKVLEEIGELENTIIVVTGDHGMPFPRCKSNLYDWGVRVPLAVRWGARLKSPGRRVTDFVSLTDLAPTFLEAAGVAIPDQMNGRSLLPIINSDAAGQVDPSRDHVIFGKERHVPSQPKPSMAGYPSRGLRNDRWLYIRNFEPDRWPNGIAEADKAPMGWWYSDTDDGPTKSVIINDRDQPGRAIYYTLCFAKRPAEELYDAAADPDQLQNLAAPGSDPAHADTLKRLRDQLTAELRATGDPRIVGGDERFEQYPYYGSARR